MNKATPHPASFKDPAGFVFESEGILYRQVNQSYAPAFDQLHKSGLYNTLVAKKAMVAYTSIEKNLTGDKEWLATLQPERIPFISYPYEWSFDQLKDAALLTLSITKTAIQHGMVLKDATPFNIQFANGRPVFIDTLSFDLYDETAPWVAYRQFCETFLFPLYLEHYLKADFIPLLAHYIHGIPVDLTARLLPWKSKWNLGVRLHVLLQRQIKSKATKAGGPKQVFSKTKLMNLLNHLESIISSLSSGYTSTSTWSDYYDHTILGKDYLQAKEKILKEWIPSIQYKRALDLGANDGYFSRLLAANGKEVIAADFDSQCINNLYQQVKKEGTTSISPVVVDLSNPSAAIGFANTERASFFERSTSDLVLALALIHHLAITRNIPLERQAAFFKGIAPQLIIELVPKEDDKVKEMLSGREDSFPGYNETIFEAAFGMHFNIQRKEKVPGTHRTLYFMTRK